MGERETKDREREREREREICVLYKTSEKAVAKENLKIHVGFFYFSALSCCFGMIFYLCFKHYQIC